MSKWEKLQSIIAAKAAKKEKKPRNTTYKPRNSGSSGPVAEDIKQVRKEVQTRQSNQGKNYEKTKPKARIGNAHQR